MEKTKGKNEQLKKFLFAASPTLTIILVFVIWQLIVKVGDVPKWMFAPADATLKTLINDFPSMWPDIWWSIQEIVFGYIIGVVTGIVLALIFTSNKTLDRAISPYVIILIVTPMMVLVPILMIYFGFGMGVKIFATALSTFPINMMNTMEGVRNVDPARYELMKSLRATKVQTFFRALVPSALPSVFTGMRVGCIFATTSAISAEFSGSSLGIAPRIMEHTQFMHMDNVLAYIIVLAVIGSVMYFAVSFVESKFITWKT